MSGMSFRDDTEDPVPTAHVCPPEHYNKLTPAEAERLALLAEECGEVVQAVGKILRHGYTDGRRDNRARLVHELAEVTLVIREMALAGDFLLDAVEDLVTKKARGIRCLHHQPKVVKTRHSDQNGG